MEERRAQLQQANSRLSVVAREAVHRSRNLIAVITAMARQSAKTQGGQRGFVDGFVDQLEALACATAAVMQSSDKSSIGLQAVIRQQLAPVMLTYPDKLQIEGPDLDIAADAAQQISLAMHELATNAQKYGSLKSDGAPIRICCSVTATDRFSLLWREALPDNTEFATAEGGKGGFGTRGLTRIIPMTLRGRAARTFSDNELRYELNAPLSAITPIGRHSADIDSALAPA